MGWGDARAFGISVRVVAVVASLGVACSQGVEESSTAPKGAEIESWIEEAIAADPRTGGAQLEVQVAEGIASLAGTVPSLAAQRYAVLLAKRTLGVRGVVDQISVLPAARPDTEIAADVRRRILDSSVVQSSGLEVLCRDAVVTLRGRVSSGSQRVAADLLASEVRGVKQVVNRLKSVPPLRRADSEIHADVAGALARDVDLRALPIEGRSRREPSD